MKQYIFAGLVVGLIGGGCESLTSGPSPLETYDQDRLYVLINAAVSRGRAADCARYFQEADNQAADNPGAGFSGALLSQVCPESMVKIATYLEHNGVAGVKAAHVKDVAFWERMQAQAAVDGERVQQEREQEQEARRKLARAKAAAVRECQQRVDSKGDAMAALKSMPLRKDFPDLKEWTAAYNEASRREIERQKRQKEERAGCDSAGGAGGGREERRAPSLADLGISLPEGMRVGGMGRIN